MRCRPSPYLPQTAYIMAIVCELRGIVGKTGGYTPEGCFPSPVLSAKQLWMEALCLVRRWDAVPPPVVPTLAPVLTGYAFEPESYFVVLNWTSSNRTDTPGFRYVVEYRFNGGSWQYLDETVNLDLIPGMASDPGYYEFRVIPTNDAGGGPSSNVVGVVLPGESEAAFVYRRPDMLSLYFQPDTTSLYLRP